MQKKWHQGVDLEATRASVKSWVAAKRSELIDTHGVRCSEHSPCADAFRLCGDPKRQGFYWLHLTDVGVEAEKSWSSPTKGMRVTGSRAGPSGSSLRAAAPTLRTRGAE